MRVLGMVGVFASIGSLAGMVEEVSSVASLLTSISLIITAIISVWNCVAFVRNASKTLIMEMVSSDYISVLMGGMPKNYQNIMYEYDRYQKTYGNSYVKGEVDAYKKWHESLVAKKEG